MGYAVFRRQPSSEQVRSMLGRAIAAAGRRPRHVVCDRGKQFACNAFRKWCQRQGIRRPRYGAIGKSGILAVIERVILTLKLLLCRLPLLPLRHDAMRREVGFAIDWYNSSRPHTWLGGKTPEEVYFGRFPAHRRPRWEPRASWRRGAPCARPWALVRGSPGAKLVLELRFLNGKRHLPVVTLRRAA